MPRGVVIAVDVGGTNVKLAAVAARGRILRELAFPTQARRGRPALLAAIVERIAALASWVRAQGRSVTGVGVGVPGPVDYARGYIHFLPNIPGWKDVPLRRLLAQRLRLPVAVDNDVKLMTLGEWRYGAGRNTRNLVCLTLGTGVGGGLICEGRLYRGSRFAAGEIGHMPLYPGGLPCPCGSRGCLERYVGNAAIRRRAERLLRGPGGKTLTRFCAPGQHTLTAKELSQAARAGNRTALRLWEEVGRDLGIVLAGIVNLINPDRIVIGGGVAGAGRPLLAAVRRTIREYAMPVPARHVTVVPAAFGERAALIGASLLFDEEPRTRRRKR